MKLHAMENGGMRTFRLLSAAFALAFAGLQCALAVEPDEILPDPALEARARAISAGLRCLVCQNQSIDDSNAPLARDLRLLVRERLKAGDSDAAVMEYVTARYGAFVLLKPPFSWSTFVLWFAPLAVLTAAAVAAWRSLYAAKPSPVQRTLSAEEEAELARLLSEGEGEGGKGEGGKPIT